VRLPICIVSALCGMAFVGAVNANQTSVANVTVTRLYAYSEYGGGDVLFTVSQPPAGCDGLWLRPTDPGFKNLYAIILSAYVSRMTIEVTGQDDSIWSGSASRFCRVFGLFPAAN
jgi:hypothetical protein